jgi:hypothetical protein
MLFFVHDHGVSLIILFFSLSTSPSSCDCLCLCFCGHSAKGGGATGLLFYKDEENSAQATTKRGRSTKNGKIFSRKKKKGLRKEAPPTKRALANLALVRSKKGGQARQCRVPVRARLCVALCFFSIKLFLSLLNCLWPTLWACVEGRLLRDDGGCRCLARLDFFLSTRAGRPTCDRQRREKSCWFSCGPRTAQ